MDFTQAAMDFGVPIPTIDSAVSRCAKFQRRRNLLVAEFGSAPRL